MDVIDQSVARRGRPDLVLSCCRELRKAPFWQGLFTFWMVLPMTELQRLPRIAEAGDGPSITLGPDGIGGSAHAPRARALCERVLRHRHRDRRHRLDQRRAAEADTLDQIDARIGALGGATRVIRWLPGDVLRHHGDWQVS